MRKEIFGTFHKEVQTIDSKKCDNEQLRALFAVYGNIHFLVFTMPWLSPEYGSLREIRERLERMAEEMIFRMNTASEESQVEYLNVLLELFPLIADREREGQALEKAYLLLENSSFIQEAGFEVSICRLACKCYYLIPEEELKERIETILRRWYCQQSASGIWEGITHLLAIKRLLALDAYHTVTSDAKYHTYFRTGAEAYLNHITLPANGEAGCNEEQILTYCNIALLQLNESVEAKNDLPEQIEKIIEEYLDRYMYHHKSLCSEVPLYCISVLIACMQRELEMADNPL